MKEIITYLWLALIPTQLGRHFWLVESRVLGMKIDYLSIILYLSDILWVVWIIKNHPLTPSLTKEGDKTKNFWNRWLMVVLVLAIVVGNVVVAQAKLVAVYRWLRVGQWLFTFYLVSKNKKDIEEKLLKVIPWWIIIESFLALAQVVKGGSLQGIWWWFGERRFLLGNLGIAEMRVGNEAWVRAYGTFSHPNSLAGFLLLAWIWWRKSPALRAPPLRKGGILKWVVNWSALLGIVLAGSRTVWVLSILILIQETRNEKQELKGVVEKVLIGIGLVTMVLRIVGNEYELKSFLGGWDKDSWSKRVSLVVSAKNMFIDSPFLGIGNGNFVSVLPKYQEKNIFWLQPVHNIFLLILSEIGIFGVVLLCKMFGRIRKKNWQILGIIIVTGMLDHYWVTLPQNFWLAAIILGLMR
ncbi:MAG: O-antigen ligase family protein [Candidatus Shapirobacteria bacterium]